MIERPVFIVAPPRSGGLALLGALGRAEGAYTAAADGAGPMEGVYELEPVNRDWDSNRLTAADAQPRVVEELRGRLKVSLTDRDGGRLGIDASGVRWVDGLPRNALRIPFLNAIAPDCVFVFIQREPVDALASMLEGWKSERLVSYPDLPDWPGPKWSGPLVPGWRDLAGLELPEIVTEQWVRITGTLLDDLEALPSERWAVAQWEALLNEPRAELERICGFVGLDADDQVSLPLRSLRDEIASGGPKADDEVFGDLLERTEPLAKRARDLLARPQPARKSPPPPDSGQSPLRSVYTQNFPQMLQQLGSSLIVSTYQTGKLICAREDRGTLNTHFRDFPRPMGLAVAPGRIAIGTRAEVLDYRNVPEVAPKIEPKGKHDACFLPRNKHFTGDIRIHEIAFAQGELWIAATNFSCLATLDAEHSFVPRWTPPFISKLGPEDRCHLNGMCVVDDRVKYVTALGETDEPGGWRERKADGGILIDVESGETVLTGSRCRTPRAGTTAASGCSSRARARSRSPTSMRAR